MLRVPAGIRAEQALSSNCLLSLRLRVQLIFLWCACECVRVVLQSRGGGLKNDDVQSVGVSRAETGEWSQIKPVSVRDNHG